MGFGPDGRSAWKGRAGSNMQLEHRRSRGPTTSMAKRGAPKLGLGGERNEEGHVTPMAHFGLVLRLRD